MSPNECGSKTLILVTASGRWAIPLHCHRWDCLDCAESKKRALLARLKDVQSQRFMTLTCNPAMFLNSLEAFHCMSKAVPNLVKRIRRQYGRDSIEYFLVWETTAAGWPHAHLLLRGRFIPQPFLSKAWAELTGAPIVDIRRLLGNRSCCFYVTKYLVKDPVAIFNAKRFRMSRHFLLPSVAYERRIQEPIRQFWVAPVSLAEQIRQWRTCSFNVSVFLDGSAFTDAIPTLASVPP